MLTLYRIRGGDAIACGRIVDGSTPHLAMVEIDTQAHTAICGIPGTWDEPIWMPQPRATFESACASLDRDGLGAWIWPGQESPISDVPSLRTFLAAHGSWRFVLDPVGMLTPAMLDRTEDHLARIFMAMGGRVELGAVVVCDAREESGRLVRVPLGEGQLPIDAILALWNSSGASDKPAAVVAAADAHRLADTVGTQMGLR